MARLVRLSISILLGLVLLIAAGCSLTNPFAPSRPTPKQLQTNKTPVVQPGPGTSELMGELDQAAQAVNAGDWKRAKLHTDAADRVWAGVKQLPHDETQTKMSTTEHSWKSGDTKTFDQSMTKLKGDIAKKDKDAALARLNDMHRLASMYAPKHEHPLDDRPLGMSKPDSNEKR